MAGPAVKTQQTPEEVLKDAISKIAPVNATGVTITYQFGKSAFGSWISGTNDEKKYPLAPNSSNKPPTAAQLAQIAQALNIAAPSGAKQAAIKFDYKKDMPEPGQTTIAPGNELVFKRGDDGKFLAPLIPKKQ